MMAMSGYGLWLGAFRVLNKLAGELVTIRMSGIELSFEAY